MNAIEKIKRVLLSLIMLMIIQGCTKDDSEPEPEDKKVLQVTTSTVSFLSPVEATINGRIAEVGETEITDHGFNFSESADFPAGSTTQHALGAKTEAGSFSAVIDGLSPETTYHFQAYAKDSEGEVLGEASTFTTVVPSISGVQPAEGSAGEEVVILGNNFVEGVKIMFGEVEAEIVEVGSTSIKVIVPNAIGIELVGLSAVLGDMEYTSEVEFLPIVGKWEEITSFPGVARNFALSFTIEGKAYVGLGFGNGQYLKDMWEYDPSNDSWKQLNDFPQEITETLRTSFSIDGVGYVGIGVTSNEFWQYDVQDDLWLRVADFPGTQEGFGVNTFVIDGKAFVGRRNAGTHDVEFWMYDPINNFWSLKAPYSGIWPDDMFHASTETAGYLGLGLGPSQVWRYSPSTNEWEQMNDFPAVNGRNEWPTAFSINRKMYAGIGHGGAGVGWDKNFWQYDEANDDWILLSDFPFSPTEAQVKMVVGGHAYIGLGNNGSTSFYKFTPPSE